MTKLWEMSLIFACVFALTGLLASIGYACSDLGAHEEPASTMADSHALVLCMNGKHISLGDGYVLRCSIKKVRT